MVCKESLGLKIRTLRKAKKITQEKFSEMIDVSPRHMINIEMGYVFPSIETLQKAASCLDVSIKSLFDDEYYNKPEYIKEKLHKKIDLLDEKNLRTLYIVASNME
ncbi:helix-turn-helix transcriptional regulator [bacterium]|nr:helix-turn-helix transcriptional regulator [bacterium]